MTDVPRRITSSSSRLRRSKNEILRSTLGMYLKQRNYTASVRFRRTDLRLTQSQRQAQFAMRLDDDMAKVNSMLYSNVMCLNKNAGVVDQQFDHFLQFVRDQPNDIRIELQSFVCPLICHLFVELLKGKDTQPAHDFLRKYAHLVGTLVKRNGDCLRSDNTNANAFNNSLPTDRCYIVPGSSSPSISSTLHLNGFAETVTNLTNGIGHDGSGESKPGLTSAPNMAASIPAAETPARHAIVFEADAENACTKQIYFARLVEALSLCERPEDVDDVEVTRLFRYGQHEVRVCWATVLALKQHFIASGHVMVMHMMQTWFAFDITDGGDGSINSETQAHRHSMTTRADKKKAAVATTSNENKEKTGMSSKGPATQSLPKSMAGKPQTLRKRQASTKADTSMSSTSSALTENGVKTITKTKQKTQTTTLHNMPGKSNPMSASSTNNETASQSKTKVNNTKMSQGLVKINMKKTLSEPTVSTKLENKSQTSLKSKTARIANKESVATKKHVRQLLTLLKTKGAQLKKRHVKCATTEIPLLKSSATETNDPAAQPNAVRDRMVLRNLRCSALQMRTMERPIRVLSIQNAYGLLSSADVDAQQCHIAGGFGDSTVRMWPLNPSAYSGRKPYASVASRECAWSTGHNDNDLSADDFAEEDDDDEDGDGDQAPATVSLGRGRRDRHKRSATGVPILGEFATTCEEDDYDNVEINGCGAFTLRGHSAGVTDVLYSRHQPRLLYSVSKDREMRAWLSSGSAAVYRGHTYAVWCLAESPAVPYLVTGSRDLTARLWSSDREFPVQTYVGHTQDVEAVAFHPNGNYLATGSTDLTVRLWCVTSGKLFRVFNESQRPVQCIAFSPDGKLLAAAGEESMLRIFDLAAGAQLAELPGHTALVTSVSWSTSGDRLVSGCADGTIRTFDVQHLTTQPKMSVGSSPKQKMASVGSNLSPSGVVESGCRQCVRTFFSHGNATVTCIGSAW